MKEVTKDEFYAAIGPRDVIVDVQGKYPYTSVFKMRHGGEVGRKVGSFAPGTRHPVIEKYFLRQG